MSHHHLEAQGTIHRAKEFRLLIFHLTAEKKNSDQGAVGKVRKGSEFLLNILWKVKASSGYWLSTTSYLVKRKYA